MKIRYLLFFFVLPLVLVSTAFFSWPLIRLALVDWTLREYGPDTIGVQFSYDKITIDEGGQFVLHNLSAKKRGMGELQAETGNLYVKFDVGNKTLVTKLSLEHFTLQLPEAWKPEMGTKKPFFFKPSFTLKGSGTLLLPNENSEPISISLESAGSFTGIACLPKATFRLDGETISLECERYKIPCPLEFPLATLLAGELTGNCAFSEGTFTGKLTGINLEGKTREIPFVIEKGELTEGELTLSGVKGTGFEGEGHLCSRNFAEQWQSSLKGTLFDIPFEGSLEAIQGELLPGSGFILLSPICRGGIFVTEPGKASVVLEGSETFALNLPIQDQPLSLEASIDLTPWPSKVEGFLALLKEAGPETVFFEWANEQTVLHTPLLSVKGEGFEGTLSANALIDESGIKVGMQEIFLSIPFGECVLKTGKGSRACLTKVWSEPHWKTRAEFKHSTFSPFFENSLDIIAEGTESELTILRASVDGALQLADAGTIAFTPTWDYKIPFSFRGTSIGPFQELALQGVFAPNPELTSGTGTLTWDEVPYTFVLDHFALSGFDCWLGSKNEDLIRLVGSGSRTPEGYEFILDNQKTHIGGIYPSASKAVIDSSGECTEFLFKGEGDPGRLLSVTPFRDLPIHHFSVTISKAREAPWGFYFDLVKMANGEVSLEGTWEGSEINIAFCGIEAGDLTIGLEGLFDLKTNVGTAHINLLEGNLPLAQELTWKLFPTFTLSEP